MKISSKGRYSVHFMVDLAMHGSQGVVLMKDVAKRQHISEKYLSHFVPLLKNWGLINATRGANGGVSLARHPREITLKDIISAVEGPIIMTDCADDGSLCQMSRVCAVRDFWSEAAVKVNNVFESYTLEQLVQGQRVKQGFDNYVI
ncbi:MAG: Rrf2 family transcriptional regulator [Candidatus Omnitrophota bacterium]